MTPAELLALGREVRDGYLGNRPAPEALATFSAGCLGAWERLPDADRRAFGQVYTPPNVVDQILDDVGFDGRRVGRLLDPACGTGALLARAAGRIAAACREPDEGARRILTDLAGIEIRPEIADLARLHLELLARDLLARDGRTTGGPLPAPAIVTADALEPGLLAGERFRWIVGNPPYLEAKRAEEADKRRWRSRFAGRVEGAFDLYVCFLEFALEHISADGDIGMVIPNKFMVNRYARSLRRRLLAARPPRTLRDLSHLPIFRNTGVYPIILHLAAPGTGVCTTVGPDGAAAEMDLRAFEATGAAATFCIPPDPRLGALMSRLLTGEMPRLAAHLQFRSTVSFHKKGLRERYVAPGAREGRRPYLGGKSWMRRKEIAPFAVEWDGYGIRYAAEELAAIGNPLPPEGLFDQPKIVICQHARRLMAYWDENGEYVTKDVYPIALAPRDCPDPAAHTAAWTALLNSRILSALYAVLFRGISIGGGYFHFLPAFLEQVPCPALPEDDVAALARTTASLQRGSPDPAALAEVDAIAGRLYGLSDEESAALAAAFRNSCDNADPVTGLQRAL
ncbi:MAG: N-6 DNA methylase [Candidatus Sericytochromatia bacterium]|nr:N-6 DNA methylase [Candidatus Tanganyikabacteria bacterium]